MRSLRTGARNGRKPRAITARATSSTLTRGFVWLNGHNLGRYPEVSRDDSGRGQLVGGVYLPECWLKDGPNDLVIFDLDGAKPEQVKFSRYEVFAVANAR